jgi:hypothetical protein
MPRVSDKGQTFLYSYPSIFPILPYLSPLLPQPPTVSSPSLNSTKILEGSPHHFSLFFFCTLRTSFQPSLNSTEIQEGSPHHFSLFFLTNFQPSMSKQRGWKSTSVCKREDALRSCCHLGRVTNVRKGQHWPETVHFTGPLTRSKSKVSCLIM